MGEPETECLIEVWMQKDQLFPGGVKQAQGDMYHAVGKVLYCPPSRATELPALPHLLPFHEEDLQPTCGGNDAFDSPQMILFLLILKTTLLTHT